jgi:hypothetical protein
MEKENKKSDKKKSDKKKSGKKVVTVSTCQLLITPFKVILIASVIIIGLLAKWILLSAALCSLAWCAGKITRRVSERRAAKC